MTTPVPASPSSNPPGLQDWVTSWLRTVVPIGWGALVAFLLSRFPDLHETLVNPAVTMAVTGLVVAVWYSIWRWAEPHLPAWLTRFLLGSNKQPLYTVVPGQVTSVHDEPYHDPHFGRS